MLIAAGQDPNFMMYAGSAVFLVGLAWFAMRWTGRTVKKDLDPANTGKMRASMALKADVVPPTLVKEALAKGLVSSAQLATMSPLERQYFFAQLKPKLAAAPTSGDPPPLSSTILPLKPMENAAANSPQHLRSTQSIATIPGKPMSLPPLTPEQLAALGSPPSSPGARPPSTSAPAGGSPAGSPPDLPSAPPKVAPMGSGLDPFADQETLRVHCPSCGILLTMPTFQPYVTFCDRCGAKTAVRIESQGRLVINTALPGVTRRPIG